MSDIPWFDLNLGPGWKVDPTKPGRSAYTRTTDNSDGTDDYETAVRNDDGTSNFTKSHHTWTVDTPDTLENHTQTTYTKHDVDGTVISQSSVSTSEIKHAQGSTRWSTTITHEDGSVDTQSGFSFQGEDGGDQTVTTNQASGLTREDKIEWQGRGSTAEGTRTTTISGENGPIVETVDGVVRGEDGNWIHDPEDTDDDDPGDNPADGDGRDGVGGDGGDGGDDDDDDDDGADGAFGPGGPDTGDDEGEGGGFGNDDDDDDDDGDDGPGEQHQPTPVIFPK